LKELASATKEFLSDPIDNTQKAIVDSLIEADRLEALGNVDEAQQLRANLFASGAFTVTGVGGLAFSGSKVVITSSAKLANNIADSKGSIPEFDETVTNPPKTSGAENIATTPKLRDQLRQENLDNIAKSDDRLGQAVRGSGSSNPNFGIGRASASKADELGKTWVGDGAVPVRNQAACPGCLKSADGTRIYRPPTVKNNTPAEFNPTGIQANFVQLDSKGTVISNGHLVIE